MVWRRRAQSQEEQTMGIDEIETGAEAPPEELVQSLRAELDQVRREAQEKHEILQSRNDELVRVKADLDRVQGRLRQMESAAAGAQDTLSAESEHMRVEFQAQLALLQAELSQKQWAFEERLAKARGREQELQREIEKLRVLLRQGEARAAGERDFVFDEPGAGIAAEGDFELNENGVAPARASGFAAHRRWHTGFAWKRRWRS
jgi:predicted  nucleic acid-binding Zn-ribbon protein